GKEKGSGEGGSYRGWGGGGSRARSAGVAGGARRDTSAPPLPRDRQWRGGSRLPPRTRGPITRHPYITPVALPSTHHRCRL
ncbi:hypothetical protein NL513_29750, partial [Klebsiella pneumoniae]|nr:hypothetical protein [Klebsiella pneumoniae]